MLTDISFDEAQARIAGMINPITEAETHHLDACLGAVLAETLIADKDVPPQDTAAVDGFAFRYQNYQSAPNRTLAVRGLVRAGHPLTKKLNPSTAIRIYTGGAIPSSAGEALDTIAMQEYCEVITRGDEEYVRLPASIRPGSNVRLRGENIRTGEAEVEKATRLSAAELGLAAAMGLKTLSVMRRLRVAIISTGDELADKPEALVPGKAMIYDSNRPMLSGLLTADGYSSVDYGIIADNPAMMREAFSNAAATADAVISTGGSSEGPEDYTRATIEELGGTISFWRVTMKPGRPFAAGMINNTPVFSVPGNPVAVFVVYHLLVKAGLARLSGASPRPLIRVKVTSGFSTSHRLGRTDFLRVKVTEGPGGKTVAQIHGRRGAGVLTSVAGADGLLEIPSDHGDIKEGEDFAFIPLKEAL